MLNGLASTFQSTFLLRVYRRFLLPSLPFSPSLNPCSHPFLLCQPPPTPHPSHTLVAHPFSLPPFSRIELTRVPHEHDRAGVRRVSYDHFSPASSYMVRPPTPPAPGVRLCRLTLHLDLADRWRCHRSRAHHPHPRQVGGIERAPTLVIGLMRRVFRQTRRMRCLVINDAF